MINKKNKVRYEKEIKYINFNIGNSIYENNIGATGSTGAMGPIGPTGTLGTTGPLGLALRGFKDHKA